VTRQLDPQARALIDKAIEAGNPEMYDLEPAEARTLFVELSRGVAPEKLEVAEVSDRHIKGPNGGIRVRVYSPMNESASLPALVYFHGGGWVIGDLETHDAVCRWLSVRAQCVVVSVDYRMGPEHKFPAAVEDCVAATKWVLSGRDLANVDPRAVAVGGDSAGANLAAVVTHELKDSSSTPLSFQLLIYPATDLTRAEASQKDLAKGYRLTGVLMDWFINHYLNRAEERIDPRASPLFANNFSNLPPALVITAGFDPLRDEGLRYNEKLEAAGVATHYRCYDGMIHGFMSMGGWLDKGNEALDYAGDCLAEAFSKVQV